MAPTSGAKENTKQRNKKKDIQQMAITKPTKALSVQFLRIRCPICFENINKEGVSSTKCGHVFCTSCLQKAMKRSSMCPTCRTRLRGPRGHHPLFLDTTNITDEPSETELYSDFAVEVARSG